MKVRKLIGASVLILGAAGIAAPSAYAVNKTTTTVGVDDGSSGGNTPVFSLAAGGAMTFSQLDLSQEAVNGLYDLTATSSEAVQVDDRRGLEDGDASLPWRVTAIASALKGTADIELPVTNFQLTMGTPATGSGNNVSVEQDVEILKTANIVGRAAVGRGKTTFAPAAAKIKVAETAVKGSYNGTIEYTLVSGI
ncbi:WxL domain-containing protein [Enterococcus sp. LJL128]|uniref:hypothetical protein n=1 Tax=Enterococcus sp. LJL51 TaxID=3416656 RepID=UPI003CF56F66